MIAVPVDRGVKDPIWENLEVGEEFGPVETAISDHDLKSYAYAVDDFHPARAIAAVGVIIAREQVAVWIEGQFLRVAQPDVNDLQLGAIGVTAEDSARVRIGEDAALGLDVQATVADAAIEPTVGSHFETVKIMPDEGSVYAIA